MEQLEILKKQIEALNELVRIKDQTIEALKAQQVPQVQYQPMEQWPGQQAPWVTPWVVTCDSGS